MKLFIHLLLQYTLFRCSSLFYMHTYRTQTGTVSAKVAPDIIMSKYISNSCKNVLEFLLDVLKCPCWQLHHVTGICYSADDELMKMEKRCERTLCQQTSTAHFCWRGYVKEPCLF